MKSVLLILLFFTLSPIFAQGVKVQGHLIGDEKQDLEAGTVRCYINDTIFVIGTTTNMKGEFELRLPSNERKYSLRFNYLGYKETTVTLPPSREKLIRLGDIILDKQVTQIHEVTVMGSNEIKMEDKTMYYPTRAQLRHAYDGFSAIQSLMIPGVEAGGSSVSYFGQKVLLCIDGREATTTEIQNLNSNDIKRVDFYQQGRPDYPEADVIFDYILKERDYLGSIALNVSQQLNRPTGNGRGTAQYFDGRSEWAVSVSDQYNHFKQRPESFTETTYLFPDETIVRTDKRLPSLSESNNLQAYLNYVYKDKKQMFSGSLRMNRRTSDNDSWASQQYNFKPIYLTKQEKRNSTDLNPALQLYYLRDLPRKQKLKVGVYGSHGNNQYDRWYEQREGETFVSAYNNGTEENSWYGNIDVNYSKSFKNASSLTLTVMQDLTHINDLNTKMDEVSKQFLKQSNTRLALLYNYKIKKRFNLQLKLAEKFSYTQSNNENKVTVSSFIPSLKLSYNYKKHSLQLVGMVVNEQPSLNNRTGYEYRMNEYEMFVGNPELKDYLTYSGSFMYNLNLNRRWTFIVYSEFTSLTNQVYSSHYYDADRKIFVFKSYNGGRSIKSHSEFALDYAIIPKKLFFRTVSIYNHINTDIWRKMSHDGFIWTCNVTWMNNGWYARLGYLSATRFMDYIGKVYHSPHRMEFNVRYSINNFHVALTIKNPYKAKSENYIQQPEYIQKNVSRVPRIDDHIISLAFNYRFTFGKKKHKFDNSSVNDINQSTISKD